MTSNTNPDLDTNQIDPNVASNLPPAHAITTTRHGTSYWDTTNTTRITLTLPDKTTKFYFLKTLKNDLGKNILCGEYASMQEIHRVVPDFAPRPITWGTYKNDSETHFFLCEYRDMILARDEMPDPGVFTGRLAALHQSQSRSPEGKFGFHVPTYSGYLPQYTGWEGSWEVFFSKSLRVAMDLEIKAKGYDAEFDVLVPVIFEKIVPKLLRPLESEGRSVKPALVHGDLWYGNSGTDRVSGECLVFDACCFYAHHEYEFGQWMPACNRFGEEYRAAYRGFVKPSPPEEDYPGRLDLYKLRFNTHVSALFTNDASLRKQMINDMKDLVSRYG
ncbi:uncharacterized protein ASPGLDRAFT_68560 [Aspergillus glaucus CBS 516.65]|uniref:protein-ribulosamine 3-kinase n=1 Tax=Aspergillus glaucus CBS 516.65 TaxID=1160497 RepID=A0A1L9VCP3_ASPGL|nr:hypothetical protein ASPGLDRAFT_68560 [Aspergillus glaucus CBS 516.65]OJJ81679.1 hypothetical protein ASPGLDRAFT_68560 [Aspergillus glaucus CBS 516.65]